MKYLRCVYLIAGTLLLTVSNAHALKSLDEDSLRSSTGQEGVDIEINFKGSIGRTYFKTNGNSLNFRNFTIDTDGSHDTADTDQAILVKLDVDNPGKFAGLAAVITNINDLDLKLEQFNVNGDVGSGDITAQNHSYGGLSLLNINDHGGSTFIGFYAEGSMSWFLES